MTMLSMWRAPAMLAGGLFAAVMAFSAVPASSASPDVPAAVAAKLEANPALTKLWADPSARTAVIVRFAMPALSNTASYDGPAAADAAQTSAIHAMQDQILGAVTGASKTASADASLVVKRMSFSPMFAITATASQIEAFAANPNVTAIQVDRVYKPMLDNALPVIGMPGAYALGATGTGWAVAVLDTGALRSHKFLNAHIIRAACFSTTDANAGMTSLCPGGVNATTIDSGANCPVSLNGCEHGSHVSGIAAGLNTNVQAGDPQNGAARDGRLISIQVFSRVAQAMCGQDATADCTSSRGSDQILALEHVFSLRNTINIAAANMSLGSDEGFGAACDDDPLQPIITQLRAAGIATVIAAGNEMRDAAVGSPGCITAAVTVAASDNQDVRAPFSNWGNQIDLVAPGTDIISSVITSDTAFGPSSGTSMASPMVAGVFAAIRTIRPTATVDQIENALKTTGLGITAAGVTKPRIRVPDAIAAIPNNVAQTSIVAAVTPVARATAVNGTVTAFATILNGGTTTATGCSVAMPAGYPVVFGYSARNVTSGDPENPGVPVDIAPGNTGRSFVIAFKPTSQMSANIPLVFDCANSAPAPTFVGLNTFLLTSISTPPADLLSIAVTATQDGIMNVPLGGIGFAALAAQNIGANANLQARLDVNPIGTTGRTLPATLSMCQTNPTTGQCSTPLAATIDFTAPPNQIVTFTAFVTSNGTAIPFDPANTRLFIHFFQGNTPVGSANVAVRTVAAPSPALASAAAN